MLDERLPAEQRSALEAMDVDWGDAYAGPTEDGGFCAYPAAVATQLGASVLEPSGLATVVSPQEPMRRAPSHQSEMISEALGGEWLTVLRREPSWWLVESEDGYLGWVSTWTVETQELSHRAQLQGRLMGRYAEPRGTLWSSDTWAASALWLGMPLLCPEDGPRTRGTRVMVSLAHGPTGWLDEDALLAVTARADHREALRVATRLLGTAYRWGGRCPGGMDCSGFVQLVFLLAGFHLPRDARQQARRGAAVEPSESRWQAGDLLFFGLPADHVGIYDGRGGLIHCSGLARRQPLGDIPQLMARLSGVRRLGDESLVHKSTLWRRPTVLPKVP